MKEITSFLEANSNSWNFWSNLSRLLSLLVFLMMGYTVQAQSPPDVTDGLPDGWPTVMTNYPYPYGSYVVDLQNDSNDDIWTEGSADVDDIGDWTTTSGNANDKNDLKNTGAVTIYDPVSLSNIIYFFADRYSSKGDSQLGYWLLQGPVERTASGFVGGHQDGDILLRTNFKNGGSEAVREVFIWLNGQLQEIDLPTTSLNFTSNSETIAVPGSWSFNPKFGDPNTYPPNSFVEGFLNLTELETEIAETFEFDFDPCFSYFLISTGQSQSETSSLADLVSGKYGSKPSEQELVGSIVCTDQDNVGTVSMLDSEVNITYQLQQLIEGEYVNVPGVEPVQGNLDGPVEFTDLTSGDYYVKAYIGNSECETLSGPVSVVVNVVEGGSAGNPQTICAGEDPDEINVTGASGDGTLSYQWQYSINGLDFSDIDNNAENASYDPGVLNVDTWFKRVTTFTLSEIECDEESTPVKITVNNIDGGLIEAAQTICFGDTPDALSFAKDYEAKGDGDLTYQWEYSDTGEDDDFESVPSNGAGETYTPSALTADTWYRLLTKSTLKNVECSALSNKIKITVNELPVPLDADIKICEDEKESILSDYDNDVLGDQVGTVTWYNGDPENNGLAIDSKNAFDLTQENVDLFAVVSLTATQCEASVDVSLTVNSLPVVQILEAPSDVVCITDMVMPGQTDELGDPVQRQFKVKVNGEFWTSDDTNGVWSGDVDENGTYDPNVNPENPDKTITFTYTDQDSECVGEDTIRFTVEEPEVSDPIESSICIADIPEGGINIRSEFLDSIENGNIVGEVSYKMNGEEFDGLLDPNALGVFSILATYDLINKACTKTVNVIITVTDCLVCETAFARPAGEDSGGDDSYCFINEVPPYEGMSADVLSSERWGWTNYINLSDFTPENNFEQTFRLYAGAGQCDINNAEDVGELSIVYNSTEDNVVVTYEIERLEDEVGYIFSGAHLYVGDAPYPSKKKGKTTEYTVAPGKYPFNTNGGMEPTYKIVYTIEDVLPEFYLIAHASACTSFTKEFMDGLWENAEVEYVTFRNNNSSMITSSGGNSSPEKTRLSSTSITNNTESLFKVSPVPFTRELNIQYMFDYTSDVNVEVYDLNGRLLRTYMATSVNSDVTSNFKVDFKTRSGKMYIIRLTSDREVFTTKVVSGK